MITIYLMYDYVSIDSTVGLGFKKEPAGVLELSSLNLKAKFLGVYMVIFSGSRIRSVYNRQGHNAKN